MLKIMIGRSILSLFNIVLMANMLSLGQVPTNDTADGILRKVEQKKTRGSLGYLHDTVFSQPAAVVPTVGMPIPYFELNDVRHYQQRTVKSTDFLGRWLVLDFWFSGCTACIASFPKLNYFQDRFKNDIQFLLVGKNHKSHNSGFNNRDIEVIFEKYRIRDNLKLASAYDSILIPKWKINAMPYIVIVNPDGIVTAITTSSELTEDRLEKVVRNKDPGFARSLYGKDFDESFWGNAESRYKSMALVESGMSVPDVDSAILFRSLLTKFSNEQYSYPLINEKTVRYFKGRGYRTQGAPLRHLYFLAFTGSPWFIYGDSLYGKIYPNLIVETADSSLFKYDQAHKTGLYNYSLLVPRERGNAENIMKKMQLDLKAYFGLNAVWETRSMPVWTLVNSNGARSKLKSKGGKPFNDLLPTSKGIIGFTWVNQPMKNFLPTIISHLGVSDFIFIDKTDIMGNIDIRFDAILTDLLSIITELKEHGMDLRSEKKEMRVLVINDN